MAQTGYVYFLLNPAMPGLVKIGFTTGPLPDRVEQLNTTGVPEPFAVGAAFLVSDPQSCETRLHKLFASSRNAANREFFHVSLADAVAHAMPIMLPLLCSSPVSSQAEPTREVELSFEEEQTLCRLVHEADDAAVDPKEIAREHGVHVQKVMLGCARLLDLGLLEERRDRYRRTRKYALTHTGRRFCFEHGIVIPEVLDDHERHMDDGRWP